MALAQTLSVTWESGMFHATAAGNLRPGTILFMVCLNTSPDRDIRELRVRADSLTSLDTAAPAEGFTPGFLKSEPDEARQDLPPGSVLCFPMVRHDAKWAVSAHLLPQTTDLPVALEAGRWCANYTMSAAGLRPLAVSARFSCGQRASAAQPGKLEFLPG